MSLHSEDTRSTSGSQGSTDFRISREMSKTCMKLEMYMLWSWLCTRKTTTYFYSVWQKKKIKKTSIQIH